MKGTSKALNGTSSSIGSARGQVFFPKAKTIRERRGGRTLWCVMCGQVCVRESALGAGPSVCPWSHNPGCGNHSQPRHLRGAHTRGAGSAGVRVRGVCARRGSARCLLPALRKLPRPPRALPPACGWHRGAAGGRRPGGQAEGGGRRRHLPCGRWALAPAGAERTARGGGPALPCAPRAAAATPAEPRGGAGCAGGAGCGRGRRSPGVPTATCRRRERTPRSQSPASARHSPRLNYLRLRPLGGSLLRVAPSRSPRGEGEFLPVDVLFRNAKDQ